MKDLTAPLAISTFVVVGVGSALAPQDSPHKVNAKILIAGGIVAVSLSVLDNVNSKLASMFSMLVFLGACYEYLPGLVTTLGFTGGKPGTDITLTPPTTTGTAGTAGGPTIVPVTNSVATPQNSGGTVRLV